MINQLNCEHESKKSTKHCVLDEESCNISVFGTDSKLLGSRYLSKIMDPPKSKTMRESKIARGSMLPIPIGVGNPSASGLYSAYVLPERDQATPARLQGSAEPSYDGSFKRKTNMSGSNPNSTANSQSQGVPQALRSDRQQEKPSSSKQRKPRPSLSDRTVETLSQIPPSPSPVRRKSSFFTSQSPMVSPIRPKSSLSHSRPCTSYDCHAPLQLGYSSYGRSSPEKGSVLSSAKCTTPQTKAPQKIVSSSIPKSLPLSHSKLNGRINSRASWIGPGDPAAEAVQEDEAIREKAPVSRLRGSKTLATRGLKPRPTFDNVLHKQRTYYRKNVTTDIVDQAPMTTGKTASSKHDRKRLFQAHASSIIPSGEHASPKSSAALRETIAKAKAAHRAVSKSHEKLDSHIEESFPKIELGGSNKAALRKRIANARSDGRLNVAAMGLKELPEEILTMYDTDTNEINDGSWAGSVDLIKLVAADNEISSLEDKFFPYEGTKPSNDFEGRDSNTIFVSLEILDLHGNSISALPTGFASLYLTTLNLSRNRLADESLGIISQVHSLQELRLSGNLLKGSIDKSLFQLANLKILDLSKNAITSFSPELRQFSMLQTLDLSDNKLSSLPLESLSSMPLRELLVSQNSIKGCLIPGVSGQSTTLKTLDASSNALKAITDGQPLRMPSLQVLNVSRNRLDILPDLSTSPNLTILTANENQIRALPSSMATLPHLKNVDLSANDIRQLDDWTGLMDSLSVLCIANNPLRERRLLNLDTEDLKRELRSRHTQASSTEVEGERNVKNDLSMRRNTTSGIWTVQEGGIVDMSSLSLQEVNHNDLESLAETNSVKVLNLQQNLLITISRSIQLLASTLVRLNLSHNKISGDCYLDHPLRLPQLKVLNISANAIQNPDPILSALSTPSLSEINISRNRLSSLPVFRSHFPCLTSVFAADNSITDLSIKAVEGLHVLDVSGNEINFLEPKIGLLSEGLHTLLVGANRFRVPRREVVEKGTQAILAWLRDRIPDDG